MLAVAAAPFDSAAYAFEVKWDGVRALAAAEPGGWSLWGRGGVDYTARYPELAVLGRLPAGTVVDGELVVLRQGRADFPALLRRHQRRRPVPAGWALSSVHYVLFDLLRWRGSDVLQEALVQRRERLQEALSQLAEPLLVYSDSVVGCGTAFFAQVVAQGHEGVMAKKLASRYAPGQRSPAWRKLKPTGLLPCVIIGYQPGQQGLARLLLATVQAGALRFVGRLQRGLSGSTRAELARRLATLRRSQPVVPCPVAGSWVEPAVYCQVQHAGWTSQGKLRHPVFRGLLQPD
jgi:bifunctional non-homologous end joining protein LigD